MDKNLKKRFDGVYTAEADSVFRYCFFRVSNREVALDMTQETFMRFWDSIREGKEIKNDRAFLFTISRNLVIDYYRKKKSLSLDAILDEVEDATMHLEDKSSFSNTEMTAEARFVMEKINELEPIHREIVRLRFMEGLPPKEIAEVLGVTANVVSVRVIRAMEKLREITGYEVETQNE
ncbi:MAG TPA: RNA polymerase sigma factor [Candidatus Paceibacterota bacterium]